MPKSFFSKGEVTKRLDLEHTITFRKMTYREQQNLISRASIIKLKGDKPDITIDAGIMTLETLKLRLTDWDGPGFEGMPCTPENIEQLDPDVAEKIAKIVDQQDESFEEDEKKD